MITNIQSEFIQSLMMNDWMDEDTKYEAIEKALSMFIHVGYADELLDVKLVEKQYLNVCQLHTLLLFQPLYKLNFSWILFLIII